MREELAAALAAVADRLTTLALQDAELRVHVRRLASALLGATENMVEPPATEAPREAVTAEAPVAIEVPPTAEPPTISVPAVPLPESKAPVKAPVVVLPLARQIDAEKEI